MRIDMSNPTKHFRARRRTEKNLPLAWAAVMPAACCPVSRPDCFAIPMCDVGCPCVCTVVGPCCGSPPELYLFTAHELRRRRRRPLPLSIGGRGDRGVNYHLSHEH